MRTKILNDYGNPELKEKVLDFLSKFEKENTLDEEALAEMQNNKNNNNSPKKTPAKVLSPKSKTISLAASKSNYNNTNNIDDDDSENLDDLRDQIHE